MTGLEPFIIPGLLAAGAGASAYGAHQQNQQGKKGLAQQKAASRANKRQLSKSVREQKRFNYNKYAGRYGEKAANKKLEKFQKKYGAESFQKHNALNPHQRAALDRLAIEGKKGLQHLQRPEDIYDIRKEKGYKKGRQGLLDMLENPGVSQIENFQPYQQGVQGIQDLLSNNPQAYQNFENQALQDFNQKVLPSIANRYAGQGAGGLSSSGFQNELKESGNDLTTRLRALRSGLQQQGRQEALQYGQAGLPGQQLRSGIQQSAIQNLLGYNQAPLAGEQAQIQSQLSQNDQARTMAQGALGVNPYTNIYRAPSFNAGIITGGPAPPNRQSAAAPPQYQPTSQWGQAGGQVLGGFAQGAGSAAAQNYFNKPSAAPAPAAGGAGGGSFKPDWAHSFL